MAQVRGGSATFVELAPWGRRPRSGALVVTPGRCGLAEAVRHLDVPRRGLLARGLGRSYNDAALNAGGVVLATTGAAEIRAFDSVAGTISVDAGISLTRLIRAVLPHGWFPAVVPGTAHVTVGGAVAADIHGKNHHRDGTFCRWVRALSLQAPGEEPRPVTPVAESEVFRATAGGMGLTGVVVEATLQLLRVESAWVWVDTVRTSDLDDTMSRMAESDVRHRYAVAWLDLAPGSGRFARGVLTNADHASREELPARLRVDPLDLRGRGAATVPDLLPSGLLRGGSIRALNSAWFHVSRAGRSLQPLTKYFFPLDRLAEWNRAYGRRGFVQYQIVAPQPEVVRAVVERLRAARCPVALAVLKRFGPQADYLSFPLRGWTLAVDVPIGHEALPGVLDRCDELVAAAGGRVYLAKDARVRPEVFRAMYPRYQQWREVRDRLDPRGGLRSDLGRRLGLVG